MQPKNVLITGASGFFGGLLKRRLLAEGFRCTNIDLVADTDVHPFLTSIQGDIRDNHRLTKLFEKERFTAVFHCAPPLAHDPVGDNPLGPPNVDGSRNIAEACRRYGVSKLIFTSTNCLW